MSDILLEQLITDRSKNWWFGGFISVPLNGVIVLLYEQSIGEPQTENILGFEIDGLMPLTIESNRRLEIEFEGVIGYQSFIESFYLTDKCARPVSWNNDQQQPQSLYNILNYSEYIKYVQAVENGLLANWNEYRLYQICTKDHIIEVVAFSPPRFRWSSEQD